MELQHIQRLIAPKIKQGLSESKLLVLRGARKVGKTTLLKSVLNDLNVVPYFINCEDKSTRTLLSDSSKLEALSQNYKTIIFQEAQYLENLQILIDTALQLDSIDNLILCCSFEPMLQEDLWEALRYQGLEISLYPFSYQELAQFNGLVEEESQIENRLIYGYYPALVNEKENPETAIYQLLEESIGTQLGAADRINKTGALMQLLRLLAFQIGETISYHDLGQNCGLDNETVERYIQLLQRAHLIFVLPSFYNERRYELKKSHIVYFVDNGVRNALIRQLQPWEFRNDHELLWKNWLLSERRKANELQGRKPITYFWKTHTKQAMDYLEVDENQTVAYKIQWDKKKAFRFPSSFVQLYPTIPTKGINRTTFWNFVAR